MTDWCQIAIELYRDGMTKAEIRRKLEITERQLERWLLDEPVREDMPGHSKPGKARKVATELLRFGMNPQEVWEELQAQGLKATLSSVHSWRKIVNGPINKRIDPEVIADIFRAYPDVKPALAAQLYAIRTGEVHSRQTVDYWLNKMRAAVRQEQMGFDLIQPIEDVAASDKILYSIELRRCTNPEHARTLPLCLFSYTQIKGKVYFRSWCKFCEASRERRRHQEVVKMRQAIEDRDTAKIQRMMTKYFRVGR